MSYSGDWNTLWAAVTAIATTLLVAVTLGAVVVGGLAAKAANDTLRLEAQPILVVRSLLNATYGFSGGQFPPDRFVRWDEAEDGSDSPSDSDTENLYGIANFSVPMIMSIPPLAQNPELTVRGAIVEIRNVGRSPAVDIRFTAKAGLSFWPPQTRPGALASGEVSIQSLAAGEAVNFIICNYVPDSRAQIRFDSTAKCRDVRGNRQAISINIPLIAVSTPRPLDMPKAR